jgi:hypothetical protein
MVIYYLSGIAHSPDKLLNRDMLRTIPFVENAFQPQDEVLVALPVSLLPLVL